MVREIVFHLGDCKTGTTSIQAVLAAEDWSSRAGHICYPARFNHMPLAKTLSQGVDLEFQARRFQALHKGFEASEAAHGVVSAEHFEFVDPAVLKQAIARYLPEYRDRVRLIAYVRPHADRFVATFAERVKKGGFRGSMAAMHNKLVGQQMLFYTPRFEAWRRLFGDQFTLRPFLREHLDQGDVVQDFLGFVLGSPDFEISGQRQRNSSLSVEDIAMMRNIHCHIRELSSNDGLQSRQGQQALGWYLSDLLTSNPSSKATVPRLHQELALQLCETYREDAAALDAAFFDDCVMSDALAAAPSKAVDRPQSFKANEHFDAEQLRHFKAWAQLLYRIMSADPEHFMWALRPHEQRSAHPPVFRGELQYKGSLPVNWRGRFLRLLGELGNKFGV